MFLKYYQQMINAERPSIFWYNKLKNNDIDTSLLRLATVFQYKNHKNENLFDHTMNVLDLIKDKNEITLFAALLHDIGKHTTSFPQDHALESAKYANALLKHWSAPDVFIIPILNIISTHMTDITHFKKKGIRNFISRVGARNIENWFNVRRADSLAYSNRSNNLIERFYKQIQEELIINNPILPLQPNDNIKIISKDNKSIKIPLSIKSER